VGACELRAIAEYLEQQARNHGLANLDGSVAELEVAFDRARAELKKLIST
jgi:hypothetical protein